MGKKHSYWWLCTQIFIVSFKQGYGFSMYMRFFLPVAPALENRQLSVML